MSDTSFLADATTLRDALVPLVTAHGRSPFPAPWDQWVPVLKVEVGAYSVVLGGSFTVYEGKRVEAFRHLEVYRGAEELLALKWFDETLGPLVLHFERGVWEQEVFWALSDLTVH